MQGQNDTEQGELLLPRQGGSPLPRGAISASPGIPLGPDARKTVAETSLIQVSGQDNGVFLLHEHFH